MRARQVHRRRAVAGMDLGPFQDKPHPVGASAPLVLQCRDPRRIVDGAAIISGFQQRLPQRAIRHIAIVGVQQPRCRPVEHIHRSIYSGRSNVAEQQASALGPPLGVGGGGALQAGHQPRRGEPDVLGEQPVQRPADRSTSRRRPGVRRVGADPRVRHRRHHSRPAGFHRHRSGWREQFAQETGQQPRRCCGTSHFGERAQQAAMRARDRGRPMPYRCRRIESDLGPDRPDVEASLSDRGVIAGHGDTGRHPAATSTAPTRGAASARRAHPRSP